MKKILLAAIGCLLFPFASYSEGVPASERDAEYVEENSCSHCADTPAVLKIAFDVRADFDVSGVEGDKSKAGFHGRYLDLMLDGDFNRHLSYHFRQRLNKFGDMKNDVFGATDWIYLDWKPNDHWTFSGGKQVVAIGGYEYDRAPINIYYASLFWNNIACYQFGVSAAYTTRNGNHKFTFQFCNSPYQPIGKTCFAYNAMWNGKMGWYSTIWSVNAVEYERGKFASLIALGNRADFGPCYIELDLMNRYAPHHRFLLDNYTVIGKVCYNIGKFDVFVKGGYEKYCLEFNDPVAVENPFIGGGLEYYPLKNSRNLRLSVVGDMTHDNAGKRQWQALASVTWKMDIFTLKKK